MAKTNLTAAEEIIALLKEKKLTLSTAESCTGGLVSSAFVDIPGASDVFIQGFVTYANEAKENTLRVSHGTLETFGAVSEECAREMAAGAAVMSKADATVSTTGIAGPGGGTREKPVGLVYVCAAVMGHMAVKELHLKGSRDEIRCQAVEEALGLLLDTLKKTVK